MSNSILSQIAAVMNNAQIVHNLNRINAELDAYAAEKLDVNDPALRRERALRDALRAEYRTRTGEII